METSTNNQFREIFSLLSEARKATLELTSEDKKAKKQVVTQISETLSTLTEMFAKVSK